MNQIDHQVHDDRIVFKLTHSLFDRFNQFLRIAHGGLDHWARDDLARCAALGVLRTYGESNPSEVSFEEHEVAASHSAIASLQAADAEALGLPKPPPFCIQTYTSGVLGNKNFRLKVNWLKGDQPIPFTRVGTILKTGQGDFLISNPMYSMLELVQEFDGEQSDLPMQWAALAEFRRLLGDSEDAEQVDVVKSDYLNGLKIYTGAAFSLSLRGSKEDPSFDPILYDPETIERVNEDGRQLSEEDGLLPQDLLDRLHVDSNTGFQAFDSAKRSYLLKPKTFLLIDETLTKVLDLVRKKQGSSAEERIAFLNNPSAAVKEFIQDQKVIEDAEEDELEETTQKIFVETPEYFDRAIEIGLWEKPPSHLVPKETNTWLPEIFTLEVGGATITGDEPTIKDLWGRIKRALKSGQREITFQDQTILVGETVLDELEDLIDTENPLPEEPQEIEDSENDQDSSSRIVVNVRQNWVEENWSPSIPPRKRRTSKNQSPEITTDLMTHQLDAQDWQIDAWQAGHLGILNADDQGLGKTLQTISFMAWLKLNMTSSPVNERLPFLVVAPRLLLPTWQDEMITHLISPESIGKCVEVHGNSIKRFTSDGERGLDTDDGVAKLQFRELEEAKEKGEGHNFWFLTTYETLTNYQHSFRKIDFSLVVFDEIQKVKNIATLNALAVRTVKADFRIGLTGTPIENHVTDLWSIIDAIAPGRLGTLKDFQTRYEELDESRSIELSSRLFKPTRPLNSNGTEIPPIAQRRLKESHIQDLPRKDYRMYPTTMPSEQAKAYNHALGHLKSGERGSMLKLIHHIRGVSLCPKSPLDVSRQSGTLSDYSARVAALVQILKNIQRVRERALIFTEDRRIQGLIGQMLRSEFGLKSVKVINAETSNPQRRKFVEEFQEYLRSPPAFDVMILSPRAAGVGITLTAATHVIHLSRWWNPAVEEQCNDRIYRIGQSQDVTIHLPLSIHPIYNEQSFDCVLNNLIYKKRDLARRALISCSDTDSEQQILVEGISKVAKFDATEIDNMDWLAFEQWVLSKAKESGEWIAKETKRSGDKGADAVLRSRYGKTERSALVQVKHTSNIDRPLGAEAVEEIWRAQQSYRVARPELVVITNARSFSKKAAKQAIKRQVKLIGRGKLGLWPQHVIT